MFDGELQELADAIRKAVTSYKQAGPIPTTRYVRIRRPDLTLQYADHYDFANFPPERLEEEIWDPNDQERFGNSVVKALPAYKSVISKLESKAELVDTFVGATCFASFQGVSPDDITKRVIAFGRELRGEPLSVKITAFLDGLSIAESSVTISQNIILRQPTVRDMAQEVMLDEYGGFSFPLNEAWFRVIGEFSFDMPSTGAAQAEFQRVVQALCLFRVGGVAASRYLMASEHSFLQGGKAILAQPTRRSRVSYPVLPSDARAVTQFLRDVSPLLPDPLHRDRGIAPREIAFTRYKDTLFHGGPIEQVVTFAITALEALFLRNEGELTRRLAQRVSVFLRVLGSGSEPEMIYKHVTDGYKIRSKFIHGETAKDRSEGDALAPILMNYARSCILAFFQMVVKKEVLIEQLDQAMIDPAMVNGVVASLASVRYK